MKKDLFIFGSHQSDNILLKHSIDKHTLTQKQK